jgi:hypothetical protein
MLSDLTSCPSPISFPMPGRGSRKLFVSIVAIALSACASLPKVDLARQHPIKTITILKVTEPTSQTVVNFGVIDPFVPFVTHVLNEAHTNAYTELVRQRGVVFASPFEADLADQLRSAGHQVSSVDLRPIVPADGRFDLSAIDAKYDYSAIDVKDDAILHVWFTGLGYVSPPSKIAFQPWIQVRVRLVDAKSRKDLYFKTFRCGLTYFPAMGIVDVNSDPRFEYDFFEVLTAKVDESIVGIKACNHAIATQVAGDFARR